MMLLMNGFLQSLGNIEKKYRQRTERNKTEKEGQTPLQEKLG